MTATIEKLIRKQKAAMARKQDKPHPVPGLIGDGAGLVETGTDNIVYVRIHGMPKTALCDSVPHINELPVWIGYSVYDPKTLRVLSTRPVETADNQPAGTGAHAETHRWFGDGADGGTDLLWVDPRQIMGLKLFATSNVLEVGIMPGIVYINKQPVLIGTLNTNGTYTAATISLASYMVTTSGKAKFVLITINTSGALVTTAGSEVDISALAITDIPAYPAATRWVIGAVRMYYGQTTFIEHRTNPDIVDLRWPIEHTHDNTELSLAVDDLSDVTITSVADGEVFVYDTTSGKWINQTLAEAGIAAAGHTHTGTYADDNVSNPPTQEEITTALGAPITAGQGAFGLLDDAGAGTKEYLCVSDGTNWLYHPLVKARSSLGYDTLTRYGVVFESVEGEDYYAVEPSVIIDGGLWKMWYRYDFESPNIGYATSPDGINWTRYASNPVLTGFWCPFVFKDGSTYHLYAIQTDWNGMDHYTSSDGINWASAQANTLQVGAGGAWDATALGNVFVWKEGTTDWRMVYEAKGSSGVWKFGYATSSDGNSWTKSGSNPVISETGSRGGPMIIKNVTTYYLWCHGAATGALPTDLYRYYSTNLTSWTGDGIVLARDGVDEGEGESIGQIADPHIVVHNGVMYLYYEGSPDGANGTGETNIKLVTAKESLIWE